MCKQVYDVKRNFVVSQSGKSIINKQLSLLNTWLGIFIILIVEFICLFDLKPLSVSLLIDVTFIFPQFKKTIVL